MQEAATALITNDDRQTPASPEQKEQIIAVLSAILDAIERNMTDRQRFPASPPSTPLFGRLGAPDHILDLQAFAADPVGQALRAGLVKIGEAAAKFMLLDELRAVADEACADNYGLRIDVIDKNFDGITDYLGAVWAA